MTSQRVAHFIVFLTSDGYHEGGCLEFHLATFRIGGSAD
jgi:hypothetical protein